MVTRIEQAAQEYLEARQEMLDDPAVVAAHDEAIVAAAKLEQARSELRSQQAPYKDRMAEAERVIHEYVLTHGQSLQYDDLTAELQVGRVSRSWKGVAKTLAENIEPEIFEAAVEQNTKPGSQYVTIEIKQETKND